MFSLVWVLVWSPASYPCISPNGRHYFSSCIIDLHSYLIFYSAPKWIRGSVVALYQFAITIGLLLASIFNNATHLRLNHSSYRIPTSIQFIWAAVLAAGMIFLPESPRFLIKKHDHDGAARAMGRLFSVEPSHPAVQSELAIIEENLRLEEEIGQSSYLDCFREGGNSILLRTLTGIFLQAWQQLTGINFIFYYGTRFFQASGLQNAFVDSVATSVVNVGMTIPGIYLIERTGRRNLLLIGAAGMVVCEFIVAIVGVTVSTENTSGQKVLIAFVCIYIVSGVYLRFKVLGELTTYLVFRPSSLLLGDLLPGSLPVKYSLVRSLVR